MPESLFNIVIFLPEACNLKKRLRQRRFPVSFTTFLKTSFSQNNSRRLHLIENFCNYEGFFIF